MKKFFLFTFWMLCFGSLEAQGGWEKILDNNGIHSQSTDFWEAPNGSFLVLYNNGQINTAWVDQDGQLLSIDSMPSNGIIESASDIVPLSDGNLLLIGKSSVDNQSKVLARKITPTGDIIWEKRFGTTGRTYFTREAVVDSNGEIMICGFAYDDPSNFFADPYLLKLNEQGDSLWFKNPIVSDDGAVISDVELSADGQVFLLSQLSGSGNIRISKVDFQGNVLDETEYEENAEPGHSLSSEQMGLAPDGGLGIYALHRYNFLGETYKRLMFYKFNAGLDFDWKVELDSLETFSGSSADLGKVALDENGNFILLIGANQGNPVNTASNYSRLYFIEVDQEGNLIEQSIKSYDDHRILPGSFRPTSDGSYFISGFYRQGPPGVFSTPDFTFMAKLDSDGNSLTNQINGQLFFDQNLDCTYQGTEQFLPGWLVTAFNDDFTYFDVVDENGQYQIDVSTGTYEVAAIGFADYWEFCSTANTAIFTNTYDTTNIDFAAQATIDCSAMWVDLSTPFLRNCFDNYYNIQYCNWGTLAETDVSIEVTLPAGIDPISAGIPYTVLPDGTLLFEIGAMEVNECADFNLVVFVDCEEVELGETLCTEARIFPDSICLPSTNWSGASIEVSGECEDENLINFLITNIGDAPTSQSLKYIVVEDQVIMSQGNFDLAPMQSLAVPVDATGSTYRLAAQQEPNHPGQSNPSITIEACGGLTPSFVNLFPMDDANPFIDIDCKEVVASYDPNDKTGFPLGREEENFIDQNIDLEYLIRFQNTGTDTAFRVVIRDTLSALLNPATVRPGASSHAYKFELLADGVLKFTFDDILLPDSSTNLLASNGFVEFKISQVSNNPIGSVINNSAAIYFDFNAPIITNTTVHTIGEALLTNIQSLQEHIQANHLLVYPNPFLQTTTIELRKLDFNAGRLELFDINGRPIGHTIFDQPLFFFDRKQLVPGIYPFIIYLDNRPSLSGQLIVVD